MYEYADKYVHKKEDVPLQTHWAIFAFTTIHIPGDERSRTNPGHGYPERDEPVVSYEAYLTEEKWKNKIKYLEENDEKYVACKIIPAKVTKNISVTVE